MKRFTLLFVLLMSMALTSQVNAQIPPPPSPSCAYCGGKNGVHAPSCRYYVAPKTNDTKPSQGAPDQINQLNSIIDVLGSTNTDSKTEAEKEAEKKLLAEKRAHEEQIRLEKNKQLKNEMKGLPDDAGTKQKKTTCIAAQKEINRLQLLKAKFENQIKELKKWSDNLDTVKTAFIDDRNKYVKGWSDDLLNMINTEKIKGSITVGSQVLKAENIEKALNATKTLKSSVEKLMENNGTSNNNELFIEMDRANKSYTIAGQLIEGIAPYAGKDYKDILEKSGRCLQMNGASAGLVNDNSWENIGNTAIDAFGLFVPPASALAGTIRLATKGLYSTISDYQIHQLSTTKSENAKAQESLKQKIAEIDNEILNNQAIVNEYKKINPAGCPVE